MLRTIRTQSLRPRLMAFEAEVTAPSSVLNIGDKDATPTRAGDGLSDLVFATPYRRAPIMVASAGTDVADGGYAHQETLSTKTGLSLESADDAGVGDDGKAHALVLGWDHVNTDRMTHSQKMRSTRFSPRMHAMRIDGATGAGAVGHYAVTPARTGAGVYTLTFKRPFKTPPVIVAVPIDAAQHAVRVEATSISGATIHTFNAAAAPTDVDFYCIIMGWDNRNVPKGGFRREVRMPQVAPRMEGFRIINTATVPALTIGQNQASIVDNGVGDYSLTWTKPFKREPVVVCTGHAGERAQAAANATKSGCQVLSFDAAGVASEGSMDVLVIGWDDTTDR